MYRNGVAFAPVDNPQGEKSNFAKQNRHERNELIPEDEMCATPPPLPGQRKLKLILPNKANFSASSRNQDTSRYTDYLFSEEPNSVLDFCSARAWRVFRQTCGFSNSNPAAVPGSGSTGAFNL
jgi:hypothetical protein